MIEPTARLDTRKVLKTVEVEETRVQITLDIETATILRSILYGAVCGATAGPRGKMDRLSDALHAAGIPWNLHYLAPEPGASTVRIVPLKEGSE